MYSTEQVQDLLKRDPEKMLEHVKLAPERARLHWLRGLHFEWNEPKQEIWQILVCGMGGSGSTGDLLQALCSKAEIPILVNKSGQIPAWVGSHTLVIGVSYSGNTAETLASIEEAKDRGAELLLLSSGGKFNDFACKEKLPLLRFEGGLPPRSALFDMLFALLGILVSWPTLQLEQFELEATLERLEQLSQDWLLKPDKQVPLPLSLAEQLLNHEVVFWGGDPATALIAQRWKNQWAENAKTRATWSVLPELNHNEMVAMCAEHHSRLALVYFTLENDIQCMDQVTLDMVQPYVEHLEAIHALGSNSSIKIVYLTYLGDFLSVYLALLNHKDPTPIEAIDIFKQRIAAECS